MKNLLDSTDIATLFVDNNLCVRRFTNETGKITRLIPGDVGRPITDIASALLYPELADDAREVLRTLAKVEKQISSTQTGCWYKVRILPYRTFENLIDGVVITFSDITEYKKLEGEFRITEDRLREQLDRK
jgi:two-component system CheB/CheR fusion protein